MKLIRRLLAVALFGAALYVCMQFKERNESWANVDLLVWQATDVAVWLLLSITFVAGAAAATLLLTWRITRTSMEKRRYRKAASKLESEIHQLRNLPLSEQGSGAGPDGS